MEIQDFALGISEFGHDSASGALLPRILATFHDANIRGIHVTRGRNSTSLTRTAGEKTPWPRKPLRR